jgi:riboflavin kinase
LAEGAEIDRNLDNPNFFSTSNHQTGSLRTLEKLCLAGRVFSGKGEGAKFVNLSWAEKQIEEKLGFKPYPGTLDIKLNRGNTKMKQTLLGIGGDEILPASGYCRGRIFMASMMNVTCGVVIPEVAGYPEDVIEVVSSVNLREKLRLVDGSLVKFEVTF